MEGFHSQWRVFRGPISSGLGVNLVAEARLRDLAFGTSLVDSLPTLESVCVDVEREVGRRSRRNSREEVGRGEVAAALGHAGGQLFKGFELVMLHVHLKFDQRAERVFYWCVFEIKAHFS